MIYSQNYIRTETQIIYLLYGLWYVGVYEPEQQISQGPALSTKNHGSCAACMSQGQVDGQQLHAQQEEMMVIPEEQNQTALEEGIKGASEEM